jgi:mono/diheme cytochrome c family protein
VTPLLAATSQERIALFVALGVAAIWVVYLFSTARRTYEPGSEVTTAPNRRGYYDDDGLEGPRLTKYLWWAFALLAVCAIGLPAYWLREPYRQQGPGFDRGVLYFEHKEIERGRELFQTSPGNPPKPREPHFGCEACHGVEGVGGVVTYNLTDPANPDAPPREVQWLAPALNTVMLRHRPEEVRNIIVYGRPGTPMPPWGVEGGGPMNDQQIDDLVAYLTSITLDENEVKAQAMQQYGTDGQRIFEGYCARCHTQGAGFGQPGVPGGGGSLGPSLLGGVTLRQFPTVESHIEWVAETAEFGDSYGAFGISEGVMPFFGRMLTQEQIEAVVAYERSLP